MNERNARLLHVGLLEAVTYEFDDSLMTRAVIEFALSLIDQSVGMTAVLVPTEADWRKAAEFGRLRAALWPLGMPLFAICWYTEDPKKWEEERAEACLFMQCPARAAGWLSKQLLTSV